MPSTIGEDYHGPECTGTVIASVSNAVVATGAPSGEGFYGFEPVVTPDHNVATIALDLKLKEMPASPVASRQVLSAPQPLYGIDALDDSHVAIEDVLVVVVLRLDDLVADLESPSEPLHGLLTGSGWGSMPSARLPSSPAHRAIRGSSGREPARRGSGSKRNLS